MTKSFKNFITELFDRPVSWRKIQELPHILKYAFNVDGYLYQVYIEKIYADTPGTWNVNFALISHTGISAFKQTVMGNEIAIPVFSTVIDILKNFIGEKHPTRIKFTASLDEPSRVSLYRKMIKRERKLFRFIGDQVNGGHVTFHLEIL